MPELGGLGRELPTDWKHVEKYPLRTLLETDTLNPVPVVFGVDWYSDFDRPTRKKDGTWWLPEVVVGHKRGGHAICSKPDKKRDLTKWWDFYNQGSTGECVGFSASRCMSLLNRARYDAEWLYFKANDYAGQPRDPYSGTYIRSAFEVLVREGHKIPPKQNPDLNWGVNAFRWATTIDEVRAALASPSHDTKSAVPLINSWGRNYPHVVWAPYKLLEYLLADGGEAVVPTDR